MPSFCLVIRIAHWFYTYVTLSYLEVDWGEALAVSVLLSAVWTSLVAEPNVYYKGGKSLGIDEEKEEQ